MICQEPKKKSEREKKKKARDSKLLLENSISKLEWKENARNYYRASFFGESTCNGLAQMCLDPSSCSPVQQAQTDSLEWRWREVNAVICDCVTANETRQEGQAI